MPSIRVDVLEALPGWSWDLHEERWQQMLEALQNWVGANGGTLPRARCYQH